MALSKSLVKKAAEAAKKAVQDTLSAHAVAAPRKKTPRAVPGGQSAYDKAQSMGPFKANTIEQAIQAGVKAGVTTAAEAKSIRLNLAKVPEKNRAKVLTALKADLRNLGVRFA